MKKDVRKFKVYEQSGHNYKPTPTITLKGLWLEELGFGAEKMLSGILEPLREKYDYILIDTCLSLGTLTINAMAASDEVIITVNPQLLAMMGMQDFLRTVVKIRKRINPGLGIAGILMTMCESRTRLCGVLTEEVTESFRKHPFRLYKGERLEDMVVSIMGHDVFQMNGRRRS